MTNAGLFGVLNRVGPFAVLGALAVAAGSQGCSDETGTTTRGGTTTTTTTSSTSGTGGTGGTGSGTGGTVETGGGGAGGMASMFEGKISEIASGPEFQNPSDAAPNAKGDLVYFTGVDPMTSVAGVFRVKADGTSTAEKLFIGAPFVAPAGISVATDDSTIYVADPGFETGGAVPGAILGVANDGGAPKVVAGTQGYVPQNLDIIQEGGKDVAYFTGYGPTGAAGVYKIDLAGGAVTEVLTGAGMPSIDTLTGVTVKSDGSAIYVVNVDTVGKGSIIEVGKDMPFATNLNIGSIGGVAIKQDGLELFVSAREGANKTSAVLRYDIAKKEGLPINDVIKDYNEPAGLHRARAADVFAFVDSAAKGSGAIFVLR
jgi:hypothetical protein